MLDLLALKLQGHSQVGRAHISELSMSKGTCATKNPRSLRLEGNNFLLKSSPQRLWCAPESPQAFLQWDAWAPPQTHYNGTCALCKHSRPFWCTAELEPHCFQLWVSGMTSMSLIYYQSPTWHLWQTSLINPISFSIPVHTWPQDPSQC